jgi:hypothetical protein
MVIPASEAEAVAVPVKRVSRWLVERVSISGDVTGQRIGKLPPLKVRSVPQ